MKFSRATGQKRRFNPFQFNNQCYKVFLLCTLCLSLLLLALRARVQYGPVLVKLTISNAEARLCRILESYGSRLRNEVPSEFDELIRDPQPSSVRSRITGRYLSNAVARQRNYFIFDRIPWCSYATTYSSPSNLPISCDSWGEYEKFDVVHALDC